MATHRPGLSFEVTAPAAVHPNRTDIACFIGTVARRRAATPVERLPELLARWLQRADPALAALPLAGRPVDLRSPATLTHSLLRSLKGGAGGGAAVASAEQREGLQEVIDSAAALPGQPLQALLAACRSLSPLPAALMDALQAQGWHPGALLRDSGDGAPLSDTAQATADLRAWLRLQQLLDLPVAVHGMDEVGALYAWEARPLLDRQPRAGDPQVCTPLGAALRAYFGEGGQRCWVLRSGDPVPLFASAAARSAVLGACLPDGTPLSGHRPQLRGVRLQFSQPADLLSGALLPATHPPADDPARWCGVDHLLGLPEVSLLALPDLADALSARGDEAVPAAPLPAEPSDTFRDCEPAAREPARPAGRLVAAPRLRLDALQVWMRLLRHTLALLDPGGPAAAARRRDVQLLASLPLLLPGRGVPAPDELLGWMAGQGTQSGQGGDADQSAWWSSDDDLTQGEPLARVQLAWPWITSRDADDCPGAMEPPEGTLAGLLARHALQRGSYRLASGQPLRRAIGVQPLLLQRRALEHAVDTPAGALTLADRVCLIGPGPAQGAHGLQLWSDVTLSSQAMGRPGSVRRLFNVVQAAARRAGEEFAFEPNGEALWARLRQRLDDLGRQLLAGGALHSDAGARAFAVRCGRDTMTQADIDAGRLIAEVTLVPAQPVLRIVVVLALRDAPALPDRLGSALGTTLAAA